MNRLTAGSGGFRSFADTRADGEVAPIPAIRMTDIEAVGRSKAEIWGRTAAGLRQPDPGWRLSAADSIPARVIRGSANRISIRPLAPPRGRIVDRFGVALATNAPAYRVVIVAEQAGDIEATLDAVGGLIPLSDGDRRRGWRQGA